MIKDCPQPESPWKPIVVGAPFWSKKIKWDSPVQLDLFEKQFEMFRAGIPRGNLVTHIAIPPDSGV